MINVKAPELIVSEWVQGGPLRIKDLFGKVIILHTFQMLCPGCILHGLPQIQRLKNFFQSENVAIIGVHTVFEHHEAMKSESLKVFLSEFRYNFPVAIDKNEFGNDLPLTMRIYGCRGTPSLFLIDKQGNIRNHYLGQVDDIQISSNITSLIHEEGRSNNLQ